MGFQAPSEGQYRVPQLWSFIKLIVFLNVGNHVTGRSSVALCGVCQLPTYRGFSLEFQRVFEHLNLDSQGAD